MKLNSKTIPFALAFAAQSNARSFLRLTLTRTNQPRALVSPHSENRSAERTGVSDVPSNSSGPLSIYAVDDSPCLTELYSCLLAVAGYKVRTFNDRTEALAALKADNKKPALLITDYLGLSVPVQLFVNACRSIHPSLRILMASGFNQHEIQLSQIRPDGFIQKPFTPEELHQAVKAVLAPVCQNNHRLS